MGQEQEQLAGRLAQLIRKENEEANKRLIEEFLIQSKSGKTNSETSKTVRSR